MTECARQAGIHRRTAYMAMRAKGTERIGTVVRLIRATGLDVERVWEVEEPEPTMRCSRPSQSGNLNSAVAPNRRERPALYEKGNF